jgi:hypothetical protein
LCLSLDITRGNLGMARTGEEEEEEAAEEEAVERGRLWGT